MWNVIVKHIYNRHSEIIFKGYMNTVLIFHMLFYLQFIYVNILSKVRSSEKYIFCNCNISCFLCAHLRAVLRQRWIL